MGDWARLAHVSRQVKWSLTDKRNSLHLAQQLTDWLDVFIMTSDKPQMKLQCM